MAHIFNDQDFASTFSELSVKEYSMDSFPIFQDSDAPDDGLHLLASVANAATSSPLGLLQGDSLNKKKLTPPLPSAATATAAAPSPTPRSQKKSYGSLIPTSTAKRRILTTPGRRLGDIQESHPVNTLKKKPPQLGLSIRRVSKETNNSDDEDDDDTPQTAPRRSRRLMLQEIDDTPKSPGRRCTPRHLELKPLKSVLKPTEEEYQYHHQRQLSLHGLRLQSRSTSICVKELKELTVPVGFYSQQDLQLREKTAALKPSGLPVGQLSGMRSMSAQVRPRSRKPSQKNTNNTAKKKKNVAWATTLEW